MVSSVILDPHTIIKQAGMMEHATSNAAGLHLIESRIHTMVSADCVPQPHMQSEHALRSPSPLCPLFVPRRTRTRTGENLASSPQRCAVEPHVCGDAAGDAASRSTVIAAGIAGVIAIVIAVAIAIAAHGRIVTAAECCHRNHRRSSFQPSLAAAKRHRSCHRSPPSPSQSPS